MRQISCLFIIFWKLTFGPVACLCKPRDAPGTPLVYGNFPPIRKVQPCLSTTVTLTMPIATVGPSRHVLYCVAFPTNERTKISSQFKDHYAMLQSSAPRCLERKTFHSWRTAQSCLINSASNIHGPNAITVSHQWTASPTLLHGESVSPASSPTLSCRYVLHPALFA